MSTLISGQPVFVRHFEGGKEVSTVHVLDKFNNVSKAWYMREGGKMVWAYRTDIVPKCARRVCNNEGTCEHIHTNLLYCVSCARKINELNPELPNLITINRT